MKFLLLFFLSFSAFAEDTNLLERILHDKCNAILESHDGVVGHIGPQTWTNFNKATDGTNSIIFVDSNEFRTPEQRLTCIFDITNLQKGNSINMMLVINNVYYNLNFLLFQTTISVQD